MAWTCPPPPPREALGHQPAMKENSVHLNHLARTKWVRPSEGETSESVDIDDLTVQLPTQHFMSPGKKQGNVTRFSVGWSTRARSTGVTRAIQAQPQHLGGRLGGLGVQSQPGLHSDCKVILGYMRPCETTKQQHTNQILNITCKHFKATTVITLKESRG